MCYRDNVPPLSFEDIHVACLCGDNGNGKSALFDAITWALWGRSRAGKNRDDELIHLGQSEMQVELEFSSGERRYRVLRKHARKPSKARAGQTVLELQIASNGTFKSVSGNSIQETQQKIIDILNLDYETFKNSAFLRQGHSDEFSVKAPGERKEVLANILGLSHYEELESIAKERSANKKTEADRLQSGIIEIDLQLADRTTIKDEMVKIQSDIKQLEDKRKTEEATIENLNSQKTVLEIKGEQLLDIENRLDETKKELERLWAKAKEQQAKISQYEKTIVEKLDIEKRYLELTSVKKLDDELNRNLSRLLNLRERTAHLDDEIKKAVQAIIIEHKVTQDRFVQNEVKFATVANLEETLTQARKEVLELSKQEQVLSKKRKQIQQAASKISHLESTNIKLLEEIADLNEMLKLLTGDDVRCPLCLTELGTEGRRQLKAKLNSDLQQKEKIQLETTQEIDRSRTKLEALEKELAEWESDLNRERAERHSRVSIVGKELALARQAGQQMIQEKEKLEELEQCLAKKDYAIMEQRTMAELENEVQRLEYNKEEHEQLRQRLLELQKYEDLKRELDEAIRNIDLDKSILAEAKELISRQQVKMEADLKKQEKLVTELSSLPSLSEALAKAEEGLQVLLQNERSVRDNIAALQERLRQLSALETKKGEKSGQLQKSLIEESIYRELAEAFSKKGIQALLIEQALPEIEMEANRLLAKITDNRMSLKLESQRETKKGETIETLDIKIADELGTRNYEMYSGGEAFRIDLALRIALSMLLVRRAGASLPILIIDEGFGTQDSSAREKLIDAINSIQDDFEKIIIITHLEEMKDKFETLITVTKTADGSMISLS